MSDNQVVTVPAHIAQRIALRQQGGGRSAMLDAIVTGDSFPRVSIRASRYRLVDQGAETVVGTELKVIFVAVNPKVSKVWYDKAYSDSDEKAAPACWSNDGVRPDASVENPVHDNCAQCPKNVLGSRITPNGKQSKLCNDIRHAAVVPSVDPTKVYGLTIPVSAMKAFRLYFKELSQFGLIPEEVITTLGFDDEASFPKMTFKHDGYVPEKHIKTVEEMSNTVETRQIIRVERAPALAAPQMQQAPRVAAPPVPPPPPPPPAEEEPTDAPVLATPAPQPEKPKRAKAAETKPQADSGDAVKTLEAQLDDLFPE